MASTYSDLKFELIGTGEQSGTWGTTTNTNLGTAIEEAITGSADVTFASAEVTLTLTDTNASQTARNLRLNLTGTSGGAQNLIVPAIEKFYLVNNGCADPITVKNSTGTGIAVPAGKAMLLFNDGTNVVDAVTHMSSVTLASALAVSSGGTGATDAATARSNLGLEIGVDVEAYDATILKDADIGSTVQAYDAGLTDIAGLAVTDSNFIVGDGTNWVAETGATARASLGLGDLATQSASSVSITGGSITGITDLAVADGGTGASSFTANSVLVGNGTSTFQEVAPGTSGNVLTSNGTTWVSQAAGGGGFKFDVFYTPGTWTKPSGLSEGVKVTVVAGGGGGSVAPPSQAQRGPGSTGGFAQAYVPAGNIPGPVAVTVGNGGNPNQTGGSSAFGSFASATGGGWGGPSVPGSGTTASSTRLKVGQTRGESVTSLGGHTLGNAANANTSPGQKNQQANWTNVTNSANSVYHGGNWGIGGIPSPPPRPQGGGGYVVVEYVG